MSALTDRDSKVPRRYPRGVFDQGSDPDTRFSLANERTYLAWNRTALALVAGAVAVHSPFLALPTALSVGVSMWLLGLATICTHQGFRRWTKVETALRTGLPMPGFSGAVILSWGIGVLTATVAAATVVVAVG